MSIFITLPKQYLSAKVIEEICPVYQLYHSFHLQDHTLRRAYCRLKIYTTTEVSLRKPSFLLRSPVLLVDLYNYKKLHAIFSLLLSTELDSTILRITPN